jgi:hypothetical protein
VPEKAHAQRAPHPASLSEEEREKVAAILDSDRFADKSAAQAWAVLLDEGCYYCSIRSMCRILKSRNEVCERRAQASHPPRVRPELLAEGPDQVWTWDITKLKTPWRGKYFDLYVMIDIFSRKAIHWEVHATETGELAKAFMENAVIANGGVRPAYIHADNGTSMTSKPVTDLLSDLHITKSHSRPHVSNDNRTRKRSSRHSSTVPYFPAASPESARQPRSAGFSSITTTTITAIPGSGSTPRNRYTTAPPGKSGNDARKSSTRLTLRTQSASGHTP